MQTHKVKVADEQEYILEENAQSSMIHLQDEPHSATLIFFTDYYSEEDIYGCHAAEYLLTGNLLQTLVQEELETLGKHKEFQLPVHNDQIHFSMRTVFVLPSVKEVITVREWEASKRTHFTVTVNKINNTKQKTPRKKRKTPSAHK